MKRLDIQGLRAIAVGVVVLDHLTGWPGGGFVGVDVFFVISGFLITGLLVREHDNTGRISFLNFYRRRFKRIIPAAMLVLLFTVAWSWLVFTETRWRETTGDAVWAALFSANWRFASQSTDYFAQNAPVSPLQHYWSLSVEEQFYFVWPWVMLLVFFLTARLGVSRRLRLAAAAALMLAACAASFAWALWETQNVVDRAYFSTFSRTWELGLGALLAIAAPRLTRLPGWTRPPMAWLGLAGIVASLWLVDASAGFPAPGALLPVVSTALVIAAGTATYQPKLLWPLTSRPAEYLGDISYSLYLWHFPIIIIGFSVYGESLRTQLVLAAAMLAASVYSYHLVEYPLHHNQWFRSRRSRQPPRVIPKSYQQVAFSLLAVVTASLAVLALQPPEKPASALTARATTPLDDDTERAADGDQAQPRLPRAVQDLQSDIIQALGATSWPTLEPSIDEAIQGGQARAELLGCGYIDPVIEVNCTLGDPDASNVAIMVGDSISMTWASSLSYAFEAPGSDWQIKSYGTFGCPFTSVTQTDLGDIQEACPDRKSAAVEAVNRIKPDVVFWAGVFEHGGQTSTEFRESVEQQIAKFDLPDSSRIVFLTQPPPQTPLAECATRSSAPIDCTGGVSSKWLEYESGQVLAARNVGGQVVDTRVLFCAESLCPPFVDGTPMFQDGLHMTPAYGRQIAPALMALLKQQGVL